MTLQDVNEYALITLKDWSFAVWTYRAFENAVIVWTNTELIMSLELPVVFACGDCTTESSEFLIKIPENLYLLISL